MTAPDRWIVDVAAEGDDLPAALGQELAEAVRWALSQESAGEAEISIALVSDATITALNRDYLSHDGPTDVLSFPLEQGGDRLVGDVYIGLDQAERQATELGLQLREELLRLVIHGTLHVLGWEHPEEGDRSDSTMYRRQEELLSSFLSRT